MQHIKTLALSAALCGTLASCSGSGESKADIIDRPDAPEAGTLFSLDALESLGRISDVKVSPDGSKVLFSISYESVEKNTSNADLYVVDIDGSNLTRLTKTPKSEANFCWIDRGRQIAYTYPVDGKPQIWVMNADGSSPRAVSKIEKGVEGFLFSPDTKKVVVISTVKYAHTAAELYPDLPDATGRNIDDLLYKHWDEWVTEIPHPFLADFTGSGLENVTDIMADEPYEAPMRPFGGVESFAWAPDSHSLIYVSRKKTGMEYALSTNSDLYLYDLAEGTTRNLTEGMMGYDTCPAYSPDGRYVAWLSMEHDGYESDKNRIFVLDNTTGTKTDLTADWDYTADAIAWRPDGKGLFFIAPKDGVTPIFSVALDSHEVSVVAEDVADFAGLQPLPEGGVVSLRHSILYPNEVVAIAADGSLKQLTDVNTSVLASLKMPTVEKRMVPTTDGKEMLVWVVLPPDFDPNGSYPALLYCQGGPQQPVSQFWSYRWNLALMGARGYIVIAPNRRGLPGFGTEWNAQISGDYPGQNMRDYLSAVDYMKQFPYVDSARIGATGASYGGFSVYWLAGNHEGRFAALLAHAGIFNTEAQYLETEEMWFANWDLGGPYWDKSNPVAQRTFASSPHKFVDRWTAPIIISHGELDYRILSSQGEMAFNAAKLRGIPAEMVIYPDENHWILKPQNAVLWQRLFFRWFDRWLKPDTAKAIAEDSVDPSADPDVK